MKNELHEWVTEVRQVAGEMWSAGHDIDVCSPPLLPHALGLRGLLWFIGIYRHFRHKQAIRL